MARDWEHTFAGWTGRASDAEQSRYETTKAEIDEALRGQGLRAKYTFEVYAKGSYPNFTNVVRDSDVDIAAELTDFVQGDFSYEAEGLGWEDVGWDVYTGSATLPGFKNDVERALRDHFGANAVRRGDKSIHVRESGRSLKADVVPCVTYMFWSSRTVSDPGIRLQSDKAPSQRIVNYPQQHYDRGVQKNNLCSRRYKRVVRILKNLENEMVAKGVINAVPSFLIESAVWNVPNADLTYPGSWTARTRAALAHIYNGTMTADCMSSDAWLEANGIKYLFHNSQNWTYRQLHAFAGRAWDYVGFD